MTAKKKSTKTAKSDSKVFTIGVSKGKFRVTDGTDENTHHTRLDASWLANILKQAGYDPMNELHHLMASSSIDFPEEDGAPEGFDAHAVLREAMVLSFPEDKQARVRAALAES